MSVSITRWCCDTGHCCHCAGGGDRANRERITVHVTTTHQPARGLSGTQKVARAVERGHGAQLTHADCLQILARIAEKTLPVIS